jgi:hypothetical protein
VGANGGDWEVEVQDLNRYVLVLQQVDSLSAGRKNSQGCEAEAGIREFSASALVAGMSNPHRGPELRASVAAPNPSAR